MTAPGPTRRGKPWAYSAAVTGGGVSVLANVAHSFVPAQPRGLAEEAWRTLPNAQPQPGAVLLAAFWPAALLLAIEVLARVDWPRELRWTLIRWCGVTPVAVVAAVVSYRHLSGLLHWYGEDGLTVAIGPAAVDGLMVVCTGALLALASRPDRVESIGSSTQPESIGSGIGSGTGSSDPIEYPTGSDRIDSAPDQAEAIAASADPGGAVVSIQSHRHTEPDTRSSRRRDARPDDVAKIRAAIRTRELTEPLRVKHVMEHLAIGPAYARAAIEHIHTQRSQEQAQA